MQRIYIIHIPPCIHTLHICKGYPSYTYPHISTHSTYPHTLYMQEISIIHIPLHMCTLCICRGYPSYTYPCVCTHSTYAGLFIRAHASHMHRSLDITKIKDKLK